MVISSHLFLGGWMNTGIGKAQLFYYVYLFLRNCLWYVLFIHEFYSLTFYFSCLDLHVF